MDTPTSKEIAGANGFKMSETHSSANGRRLFVIIRTAIPRSLRRCGHQSRLTASTASLDFPHARHRLAFVAAGMRASQGAWVETVGSRGPRPPICLQSSERRPAFKTAPDVLSITAISMACGLWRWSQLSPRRHGEKRHGDTDLVWETQKPSVIRVGLSPCAP